MIKCQCGGELHRNMVEEKYDGEICLYCPKCHFEHFNAQDYFSEEDLKDIPRFQKVFLYNERLDNGKDIVMAVTTDEIIIGGYFEKWSSRMEEVGRYEQINHYNCIKDFKTTYGAWERDFNDPCRCQFCEGNSNEC